MSLTFIYKHTCQPVLVMTNIEIHLVAPFYHMIKRGLVDVQNLGRCMGNLLTLKKNLQPNMLTRVVFCLGERAEELEKGCGKLPFTDS